MHSKVANYDAKDYPELEDYGDATLVGDNGATNYFRVDWHTPDGLSTWVMDGCSLQGQKAILKFENMSTWLEKRTEIIFIL